MIVDEVGRHDGLVRPVSQAAGQGREAVHPFPDGLIPPPLPLPGAFVEDGLLGMDKRGDAAVFRIVEEVANPAFVACRVESAFPREAVAYFASFFLPVIRVPLSAKLWTVLIKL